MKIWLVAYHDDAGNWFIDKCDDSEAATNAYNDAVTKRDRNNPILAYIFMDAGREIRIEDIVDQFHKVKELFIDE